MSEAVEAEVRRDAEVEVLEGERRQCLLTTVAEELYAFDLLSIREILRTSQMERAPGAPHFVAGLINLRGEIVTVIDAARLLGIEIGEQGEDAEASIVVLEGNSQTIGIQVGKLEEVVTYNASAVQPIDTNSPGEGEDYITGLITLEDGQLVILMDADALCDG